MRWRITYGSSKVKVGDKIRVIKMYGEDARHFDRDCCGVVEYIDDIGQLHGTWGGLAVMPEVDEFVILEQA